MNAATLVLPGTHAPTLDLATVTAADGEDAAAFVGQEFDRYVIEQFLGEGGMARVYRARHLMLERPCAIKVLRGARNQDHAAAAAAFLAEARAAAALVHPHVVAVHTLGLAQGRHFIEMEYVPGRSLADLLQQQGQFTPVAATRLVWQLSSALAAAHDIGMIHRDIKPGNAMVSAEGVAKLSDFGLAKRLSSVGAGGQALAGTPQFMAPELFFGEPASVRSDVYAMGVTYYSLLTGRLPVQAHSLPELIRYHQAPERIDWADLPDDLPPLIGRLLERCLARDPGDRFSHGQELLEQVRIALGSLTSVEQLLRDALQDLPVAITELANAFEVRLQLDGGRWQDVFVQETSDDSGDLIRIYSICGPANPAYYGRALEINAFMKHGAVALEYHDGEPLFVMVNTYPRNTCDPEEIRHSVLTIGRFADEAEKLLTGQDVH